MLLGGECPVHAEPLAAGAELLDQARLDGDAVTATLRRDLDFRVARQARRTGLGRQVLRHRFDLRRQRRAAGKALRVEGDENAPSRRGSSIASNIGGMCGPYGLPSSGPQSRSITRASA